MLLIKYFLIRVVTKEDVKQQILKMDILKPGCPDNFNSRVLKEPARELFGPLMLIVNKFCNTRVISENGNKVHVVQYL